MCKVGFLIVHLNPGDSSIYYVILEEGKLRYSKNQDEPTCGEFVLSGNKVSVTSSQYANAYPNSFAIHAQQVSVRDRTYFLGPKKCIELSAPNVEERRSWANIIVSWQRHYWRTASADQKEPSKLELQYQILTKTLLSRKKYSTKKFLQRNKSPKLCSETESSKRQEKACLLPHPMPLNVAKHFQQPNNSVCV